MKTFSNLVKENNEAGTFKYVAEITVEGTVNAVSEAMAGEAADQEINLIDGLVNYIMKSIDKVETAMQENNDNVLGSEPTLQDMQHLQNEIVELFLEKTKSYSEYNKAMIGGMLKQYFNNLY